MHKWVFFVLIVLVPYGAKAEVYSGPKCVGPFCIDVKLAAPYLFKQLGMPVGNSFPFSYRSRDRRAFLIVRGDVPDDVQYISIRDFPNWGEWEEKVEKLTGENLRNWRTPERIGLGSSEDDVIKAYGKPSGEERIDANDTRSPLGEKKLVYKGRFREFAVMAGFGIRGGKVSLLELNRSKYAGPDCIGLFCIDMDVDISLNRLQRVIGRPRERGSRRSPFYCYESEDERTYLYVGATHDVSIDGAFLSDFPNCIHINPTISSTDLGGWKTPEGIGLGSSKDDVLMAYGKPSKVEKASSRSCCGDFIQSYAKGDKRPDIGTEILLYEGDQDNDLSRSEFGLRNGRVSYIFLSNSE